jgi:ABC-type Fe3+ transport system permease subunit
MIFHRQKILFHVPEHGTGLFVSILQLTVSDKYIDVVAEVAHEGAGSGGCRNSRGRGRGSVCGYSFIFGFVAAFLSFILVLFFFVYPAFVDNQQHWWLNINRGVFI